MSRTFQKERESVGIVVLREGEQNFSKPGGWLCLGKWEGEEVGDAVGLIPRLSLSKTILFSIHSLGVTYSFLFPEVNLMVTLCVSLKINLFSCNDSITKGSDM